MGDLGQFLERMMPCEFNSERNRHPRIGLWPFRSAWWFLVMLLTIAASRAQGQALGTRVISTRSSTLAASSLSQETTQPSPRSGVSEAERPSAEAGAAASTPPTPT